MKEDFGLLQLKDATGTNIKSLIVKGDNLLVINIVKDLECSQKIRFHCYRDAKTFAKA